ncbi:hypothetical protein EDC94DRAFT_617152 [Helicostylum pulchrum]|nr:hypothetical protein EDC94DRAFT_617152 [Helicostylum pulchrum]
MTEPFSSTANNNVRTPTPPPPAYQDYVIPVNTNLLGETYYRPPPPPVSYPPPPIQEPLDTPAISNRITEYYSPEDNKQLAMKRRLSSCLCITVTIAVIIGLASGLTRNAYYSNCECQTDSNCSTSEYGANVYCYNNCECVTRY